MKKLKNILFLAGLVAFFASCESDEEKYSGTPIGNQAIEVIHGEISVDPALTAVLTSQEIPFTVDVKRTFADTVTVEVTTMNKSGGRTRTSVDVLPGDTTASEKILASGGAVFDSTMELYISGIALKTVEPGKHYLIDSNKIIFNTGNTATPSDDINRLQVRVAWFNPSTSRNNMRVYVDRPGSYSHTLPPGATVVSGGPITNPTNTVTLASGSSTASLQVGAIVNVSSGPGHFLPYTTITSILSDSQFRISRAPLSALGANSVITASGVDLTMTGASSSPGNLITVASTAGLQLGMIVTVSNGPGRFAAAGTYVTEILSNGTQFKVNLAPAAALSGSSEIVASFGDTAPEPTGSAYIGHSFRNSPGSISDGLSSQEGTYFIRLSPLNVLSSGADLRYRIVWKYPDGSTGFYDGIYDDVTLSSAPKTILKVEKTGTGNSVVYSVEAEGL
ncbi:hypothetical protein [Flavobacterium sp.]|uniref:hypothetical protein n=1 Tax=Flavobacterium sp. TaxID=239 RepID=UPI0039E40E71